MSHTASASPSGPSAHVENHDKHYVKIWAILLVLLVVSVVGPMLGFRIVTLLTAFGIAFVKAALVAKHFMHVHLERKWIGWTLVTMLALMVLMVAALAPDVLRHDGQRWENIAAKQSIERAVAAGHGDAHP